eukprot:gene229-365_t
MARRYFGPWLGIVLAEALPIALANVPDGYYGQGNCTWQEDTLPTLWNSHRLKSFSHINDTGECCNLCKNTTGCALWAHDFMQDSPNDNQCWLYNSPMTVGKKANWRTGSGAPPLPPKPDVVLPQFYTSNMVLQADHPRVFGFSQLVVSVTVTVTPWQPGGGPSETQTTTPNATDGSWAVSLTPRNASFDAANVTVSATAAGHAGQDPPAVVLTNVLFGDVWLCSGQSNMEFSVAGALDAADIIASADIPGLRLLTVDKTSTGGIETQDTTGLEEGWVESTPSTICGYPGYNHSYFCEPHCGPSTVVPSYKRPTWGYTSAVCYLHARDLHRDLGIPIGVLATSWGGTSIESWSSIGALEACPKSMRAPYTDEDLRRHNQGQADLDLAPPPDPGKDGEHYANMIHPFLNFPVKGVLWYQGEANAGRKSTHYACQLRALINDWRTKWVKQDGQGNFTFVVAQLAADTADFSVLRWSQTVAWAMDRVGMSVGIDLSDPGSPCGAVHIRNKTAVGERIARITKALAYGKPMPYSGPVPQTAILLPAEGSTSSSGSVSIVFSGGGGALEFRSIAQTKRNTSYNFEATCSPATGTKNAVWSDIPAGSAGSTVMLDLGSLPCKTPNAIRYAWSGVPSGQILYDSVPLPASPFILGTENGGQSFKSFPPDGVPVPYQAAG